MNLLKLVTGGLLEKIIDRTLPNKMSQEDKLNLTQAFEMELQNAQRDLILSESSSKDSYVSRARPTFLYLVYLILAFNFIIVPIFNQVFALIISLYGGSPFSFEAVPLPPDLYSLFKIVMLGYIGGRTYEKTKSV
ncbi:MAG: hypothetical protein KC646_10320 [Candidatus Cloacimonetes bacterium]|nr:hypothetical protein [Candidatus Cloacimonadota bacterium]